MTITPITDAEQIDAGITLRKGLDPRIVWHLREQMRSLATMARAEQRYAQLQRLYADQHPDNPDRAEWFAGQDPRTRKAAGDCAYYRDRSIAHGLAAANLDRFAVNP